MGISNALKYIAVSKYTCYTGIMQFKFFLRNFVTLPPTHNRTPTHQNKIFDAPSNFLKNFLPLPPSWRACMSCSSSIVDCF